MSSSAREPPRNSWRRREAPWPEQQDDASAAPPSTTPSCSSVVALARTLRSLSTIWHCKLHAEWKNAFDPAFAPPLN